MASSQEELANRLKREAAEFKGVSCRLTQKHRKKPFITILKHGKDSQGKAQYYATNTYGTAQEAAAAGDR